MLIKSRKDETYTRICKKIYIFVCIYIYIYIYITHSAAPKKIIWRLCFFLIGANGSLLDFFFCLEPCIVK